MRETFGFERFRPYQEAVCRAVTEGSDVLLVMPTGAGKSLCYHLPGIARAGTTVVVSPLISLMEDQVAKLRAQGLGAERIHSGRPRPDARQACESYLDGCLDFLFIAPERLGVPGFPELLARPRPALVAVDEAHLISHWGHDFRPDYRLLGRTLEEIARARPEDDRALLRVKGVGHRVVERHGAGILALVRRCSSGRDPRRGSGRTDPDEPAPATSP